MNNIQKAAVIGCGFVGSSIAFTLMQSGIFSELVLIDANRDKAEGEAMDLSHGLPFTHPMDIRAGDYDDVADCALVIVTAGAGQKPGETRLDLVHKNVAIFRSIIPEIARRNRDAILLIVSNPVDVLTWAAWKLSGYPANRVLGSGTVLDTARLKYLLGERLGVDSRSVHAFIIGEHGDSELAVWSGANVSGISLITSASCGATTSTTRPTSGSSGRCGTAPMRSSAVRGPPTMAWPWRWSASSAPSCGTSTRCSRCPTCSRASTASTACA